MKRKHSRMHLHLLSQMAREHAAAQQYDKAKRVLDGVVQMLRHEGWIDIVAVRETEVGIFEGECLFLKEGGKGGE